MHYAFVARCWRVENDGGARAHRCHGRGPGGDAPPVITANDNSPALQAFRRGHSGKLAQLHKAVGLKLRFVRDIHEMGLVALVHVSTGNDLADIHTKILERLKFINARGLLGIRVIPAGATDTTDDIDLTIISSTPELIDINPATPSST